MKIIEENGCFYQVNEQEEKLQQLNYTHILVPDSNIHNVRRFDIRKVIKNGSRIDEHPLGNELTKYSGKWGLINIDGTPLIEAKYSFIDLFRSRAYFKIMDGIIKFDLNDDYENIMVGGKSGVIDKNGQVLIPPKYTWIEEINENLFAVNQGGTVYYLELESIKCWRTRGGKWGVVNQYDEMVVPIIWDSLKIHDYTYVDEICVQNNTIEFNPKENYYVFDLKGE